MKKITLKGIEIEIAPPKSYATCWDVAQFGLRNRDRALSAALCLSLPTKSFPGESPRPSLVAADFNLGVLGGMATDQLIKAGVTMGEIQIAGVTAYAMITDSIYGAKELADSEDFTDPNEEE